MQELSEYIAEQAKKYWEKANNVVIDEYPMSIVDFVLEYAISQCHFPKKSPTIQNVSLITSLAHCLFFLLHL